MTTGNRHATWTFFLLLLVSLLAEAAEPKPAGARPRSNEIPPEVFQLVEAKEEQLRELAQELKLEVSEDVWDFFETMQDGNWRNIESEFRDLARRAGQYENSTHDPGVAGVIWSPVIECEMAFDQFAHGNRGYIESFARDIIASIPKGSLYFGGTDPGRSLITAFSKSHAGADPFFTLTQNALADSTYLDYLRAMYGGKLSIPEQKDADQCLKDYLADADKRMTHDEEHPDEPRRVKPGENLKRVKGSIQVGGHIAVMAINAEIARWIIEHNVGREVFIEESFVLDWMNPHLEPRGLILKVNRTPIQTLDAEAVQRDRDYWDPRVKRMIGSWLRPTSSLKSVCEFAEKVYLRKDTAGFDGDQKYVNDNYSPRIYSKLRSAIAGVYAWRASHAADEAERVRMREAADFAFRQAYALNPRSPEAVFRYTEFLQAHRPEDARLLIQSAKLLNPRDAGIRDLGNFERVAPKPKP